MKENSLKTSRTQVEGKRMDLDAGSWQKTAMDIVEKAHYFREDVESRLQEMFPGCRFRMVLRAVPVDGHFNHRNSFEFTVDEKSYWITPGGACDTAENFHNDLMLIQFKIQ